MSFAALVGLFAVPVGARAQSPAADADASRTNRVVHEAVEAYTTAMKALDQAPVPEIQSPTGRPSPGGQRELTLEQSVELALDRNLDIQVSRLEPQSVDLQVAGVRNTYLPVFNSTLGQREQTTPATSTLAGGTTSVSTDTTTYNFGISKPMQWGGGAFAFNWNNGRAATTDTRANFNPSFTTNFQATYTQPLIRGFRIDNARQQLQVALINRDISEESAKATVAQTLANVRNAYWDLVFARSAVDVARRALDMADRLVVDNQARVEVGTLAPLDIVQAQAEAATRRQTLAAAEATASTAELALKRFLVNGTEDPLWRQEIVPVDVPSLEPPPTDVEGAMRRAISDRTDLATARKNLDSNDVSIRFFRNLSMPALDFNAAYGGQGVGGPRAIRTGTGADAQVTTTVPGGYLDALSALSGRDFPNWNFNVTLSYPLMGSQADAQLARARVQRQQAQTRLRALEVQVAAEVANAAFTVQSNLRRVEAASAARELAQKRLEAEQSRFEVGLTTNFFVVQAQRDLRDAENTELRALADYRKSLVNFERAQQAPAGGGGGSSITAGGGS
ncbi:MAG: TolC family protein [Vicinamibacterales bacterium]